MDIVEKAIAYIPCRRCEAQPGEQCRTKDGYIYEGTWYAHTIRKQPFTEEYERGKKAGRASKVRS